MSKNKCCKHHQNTQSKWHCNQCQHEFCSDCVNHNQHGDPPVCSTCGKALVASESVQLPFLHSLPYINQIGYRIPVLFIIAILITIVYLLPFDPVVGWLLTLVILTIGIL